MTQRIQNAIDIFLDAINDGTLAKGNCTACAVGNLVAHGLGGKIEKTRNQTFDDLTYSMESNVDNSAWGLAFTTSDGNQYISDASRLNPSVKMNIDATEFSFDELAAIEYAFETNTEIFLSQYPNHTKKEIREDQIKGLEAVINLMMTFDNVEADVKEVFTNKVELV